MLIFDNNNEPIILDNVESPVLTDTFWVLDLDIMDYTLASLLVLEEIIAPTIELNIKGFKFPLPANWNILVVDQETNQLDVVQLKKIAGKDFYAFAFGANKSRHDGVHISVSNYYPSKHNVGPSLFKHQMLCHPIDSETWINVSPSDGYNKYLKNKVSGDII
jgi:hypothetical protein